MDTLFLAFEDELEKISSRVPKRFLTGKNPFKKGTKAYERVEGAKYLRGFDSFREAQVSLLPYAGGRSLPEERRKTLQRGLDAIADDKRLVRRGLSISPRRTSLPFLHLRERSPLKERFLVMQKELADSDRRYRGAKGVVSRFLDKAQDRKRFEFGKTRKGRDMRSHLRAYLAEKRMDRGLGWRSAARSNLP